MRREHKTMKCPYLDDFGHCTKGFMRFCESLDPTQECLQLILKKKDGHLEVVYDGKQ